MPEIAFRMLILLTLKDPVNMESVVFCDPKNITRGGVSLLIAPLQVWYFPGDVVGYWLLWSKGRRPWRCTVCIKQFWLLLWDKQKLDPDQKCMLRQGPGWGLRESSICVRGRLDVEAVCKQDIPTWPARCWDGGRDGGWGSCMHDGALGICGQRSLVPAWRTARTLFTVRSLTLVCSSAGSISLSEH